jgi:hypothetical protein
MIVVGALTCVAVIAFLTPDPRERGICLRVVAWAFLILTIFLIGNVFFRLYVRDTIWPEELITLMAIILLCIGDGVIRRSWRQAQQLGTAIIIFPLLILIGANLSSYPATALKTDLNFNVYGWSIRQAFMHYGGNHLLYRRLVQRRFNDEQVAPNSVVGIAFRHAVEWRTVLRTAEFVLPYQVVPLTKIGVFAPDGTITADGEKLATVPMDLSGAIVVNLQDLPQRHVGLIDAKLVSEPSEAFDKITAASSTGHIAIVPRTDLSIVLFSVRQIGTGSCELIATAAKAEEEPRAFCGQMIKRYTEVDLADGRPAFLVIHPHYGW